MITIVTGDYTDVNLPHVLLTLLTKSCFIDKTHYLLMVRAFS
jgi:hypothetical protein